MLFFGVFICFQCQTAPKRDVFVRMSFIVWSYHIFFNGGETVELNYQMDKARYNKNGKQRRQKHYKKMGDPNDCQNNASAQRQLQNAYEQVVFEIYKCQQKAVFIDLGCGQIKGDDDRPHIVAHKREYHETDEKKSQCDICQKSFGVVVKNQTEAKQNVDQKVDDTHN